MDLKRNSRGVIRLFAIFNLIMGFAWAVRGGDHGVIPVAILLHTLGAVLLFRESRFLERPLLNHPIVPWVLWLSAWVEIGWMYRLTGPFVHDGAVRQAELALMGGHPHEILPALIPHAWFEAAMGTAYLSYYLLILGPPVLLVLKKRTGALGDHTLGLMATYLACFTVYLFFPVLGPRAAAAVEGHGPMVGGVVGTLMHGLFAAGDSLGTAFPSSHCAASVAAALMVHRHFGSWAGAAAGVWAGAIVLSTVHTGNHYAVDGLAGVFLAMATHIALRNRFFRSVRSVSIALPGPSRWNEQGGQS